MAEREAAACGEIGAGAAVALGAATGLLFALALPPLDLSWFAWASFAPLFLALERGSARGALAAAAAAGMVFASQGMYGVLAYEPRLWLLVSVAVTLWPVAVVRLLLWVGVRGWSLRAVLAAPVLWVAVEALLQEVFSLPTSTGIALARSLGARQAASLVGASGLSFLLVLTGALAARSYALGRRGRAQGARLCAASALAIAAGTTAAGWLVVPEPSGHGCPARARAVQPAISREAHARSWTQPAARARIREQFWDAIASARTSDADLFVWPEGGGAFETFRVGPARAAVQREARSEGRHLFVSAIDFDPDLRRLNSVFSFGADGSLAKYDKLAPVPIAEDAIAPGRRRGVVPTAHGRAGLLVCYESCFPRPAAALVGQGAEFLIVTASDTDLGYSTVPALHLSMSILRAVENRRTVIHASNAGPSAIVDAYGRIEAFAPLGAEAAVEACVFPAGRRSFFSRTAAAGERLCQLGGLAMLVGARRRRRRAENAARGARSYGLYLRALGVCGLASLGLAAANALVVGRQAEPRASAAVVLDSFAARRAPQGSPGRLSIPAEPRPGPLEFVASLLGARSNGIHPVEAMADLAALEREARRLGFVTQPAVAGPKELARERMPIVLALDVLGPTAVLEIRGDEALLYNASTGLHSVPLAVLAQLHRGALLRVRPPPLPLGEDGEPRRGARRAPRR